MHYLAKNGSSSNYHRLQDWPVLILPVEYVNREAVQNILARFIANNITALSENFNQTVRIIFNLENNQDDIPLNAITSNMAEACACFLKALAKHPSPSAIALSTEIYCLAYIAISKQGNITDAKLTSICAAVSEETGN